MKNKKILFVLLLVILALIGLFLMTIKQRKIETGPEETEVNSAEEASVEAETEPVVQAETETAAETEDETEVETTEADNATESSSATEDASQDFEATSSQYITVVADGSSAILTFYERQEDSSYKEILSTSADIGANGIGKTKEGDRKTPAGEFTFTKAFGIKDDPGTSFEYTKVDDSYYWVDDSNSKYYNQFVSTNQVEKDWSSAEHIIDAAGTYDYVLALNYNEACTPGAGSAIFLHCKPTSGAGCIAIDEEVMLEIMNRINTDCVIQIQ